MKSLKITIVLLGIFLIYLVGAVYPGETIKMYSPTLNEGNLSSWYITENSSAINGLVVFQNYTGIYLTLPVDISSINFKLNLMLNGTEVTTPVTPSSSSSSSGSTSCKSKTWTCGDWGECINNHQYRSCKSNCNSKKNETQFCLPPYQPSTEIVEEPIIVAQEEISTENITSTPIDSSNSDNTIIFLVLVVALIIIVGGFFYLIYYYVFNTEY